MRIVRLADVAVRIDYGLTASSTAEPVGPRFLRITDIENTSVDWRSVPFCAATRKEAEKYALADGDIVVARTGASTGRSQWIQTGEPAVFASYLVRFRMAPEADSRFVSYVLQSSIWRNFVEGRAHGKSAQPNMSAASMAEFEFVLPPLPEQQAIAEVLGALDDKIAANTTLAATAMELAEHDYDRVTASWPRIAISDALVPVLGGTPSRSRSEYWEAGQVPWVSARDVSAATAGVILDTAEHITQSAVEQTKAKPLPIGSVILTARGTVGAVARLGRAAAFNQSCYGFRPDVAPPALLYLSILRATARAKAIAHGSVFDTITKATFDDLDMAWKPEGVERLEARLASLISVVDQNMLENRTLAATRDALLPQLMSGALRVSRVR